MYRSYGCVTLDTLPFWCLRFHICYMWSWIDINLHICYKGTWIDINLQSFGEDDIIYVRNLRKCLEEDWISVTYSIIKVPFQAVFKKKLTQGTIYRDIETAENIESICHIAALGNQSFFSHI